MTDERRHQLPSWWPSDKPYQIRDCLEGMKSIPERSVDLLIADPPYNEGKAEWDTIDNYLAWWGECVTHFVRVLKSNGVFYFFQMNIETAMDMHRICKENGLVLRQMITIYKGLANVTGRSTQSIRSFPKATEYLFYYTFQDESGWSQIVNDVNHFSSLRSYFEEEINKCGISRGIIRQVLGEGVDHCLRWDSSQWMLPKKDTYQRLQRYINQPQESKYLSRGYEDLRREYEELRKEYEDLRKEYEDQRYTFNLPLGVTDVWLVNFYEDKVSEHETPKPVKLIERILKASSEPGDIILDPFLGSGTSLLAARRTNRICLGFEIDGKNEPLILSRMKANIPNIESFESEEEEPEETMNGEKVKQ